ncbi:hypothetical protein NKH18_20475 [Streptomyces sp. M10(2022)]
MSIRPSVLRLLQRLTDLPALVLSAKGDLLGQNPMAGALLGDLSRWPEGRRNIIWQRFLGTGVGRVALAPQEDEASAQQSVGMLRTALSRYPDDLDLRALIEELIAGSERFWSMWEEGARRCGGRCTRRSTTRTSGVSSWTATRCCCRTPTSR